MAAHDIGIDTQKNAKQKAAECEVTKTFSRDKKILDSRSKIPEAGPEFLQRAGRLLEAVRGHWAPKQALEARGASARHASYSLPFRLIIVNALLGMRKLREVNLYRGCPVVRRALGEESIPSVPTIGRVLEQCDSSAVAALQAQRSALVLDRLALEGVATVTLNFDGSVIPCDRMDTPVTYESLQELGSVMGSGGMLG